MHQAAECDADAMRGWGGGLQLGRAPFVIGTYRVTLLMAGHLQPTVALLRAAGRGRNPWSAVPKMTIVMTTASYHACGRWRLPACDHQELWDLYTAAEEAHGNGTEAMNQRMATDFMALVPQLSQLCDLGCFIAARGATAHSFNAAQQMHEQAMAWPVIHAIDMEAIAQQLPSEIELMQGDEQHPTLGGGSFTPSPVWTTWLWVILFNVVGCAPTASHELMPAGLANWTADRIVFSPGCTMSTLGLNCAECACEATHADGQATRRWECMHARPCSYSRTSTEVINTTAAAEACMPEVQVWLQEKDAQGSVLAAEADTDLRATSRTSNVTLQQLIEDTGYCHRVWCTVSSCTPWCVRPARFPKILKSFPPALRPFALVAVCARRPLAHTSLLTQLRPRDASNERFSGILGGGEREDRPSATHGVELPCAAEFLQALSTNRSIQSRQKAYPALPLVHSPSPSGAGTSRGPCRSRR